MSNASIRWVILALIHSTDAFQTNTGGLVMMACQVSLDGGGVIRANRTKDQIEIEILELPTEAEGPSRTERLRSKGRFLAVRKAFLDPARVPPGTPITRIGVVKGSTTRRLDEGVNDRSRHVSDLDSCTGNSWNCTSNAEPRVQRIIALGVGMRALLRGQI